MTYPDKKNMENWSRCDGWPTQKNIGLIVMGDLPKEKRKSEGSKAHSKGGRVRKHITQETVAQKRTRNEVGLENTHLRSEGSKAH